jgi:hypothetical protein
LRASHKKHFKALPVRSSGFRVHGDTHAADTIALSIYGVSYGVYTPFVKLSPLICVLRTQDQRPEKTEGSEIGIHR